MINYVQIRDDIITQLNTYLGIPVVMAEQNEPKPPYPHMTYKVMTPYIQESTLPAESYEIIPSLDPDYEHDIEYTRMEQPSMTISLSAYSLTPDESELKALAACAWFKFIGYEYLKDKNIIVIETSEIQDRDTLLIDNYERRRGFDVKLRVVSEITRVVATIESVDITTQNVNFSIE